MYPVIGVATLFALLSTSLYVKRLIDSHTVISTTERVVLMRKNDVRNERAGRTETKSS